jgi:hypothetical protein
MKELCSIILGALLSFILFIIVNNRDCIVITKYN